MSETSFKLNNVCVEDDPVALLLHLKPLPAKLYKQLL